MEVDFLDGRPPEKQSMVNTQLAYSMAARPVFVREYKIVDFVIAEENQDEAESQNETRLESIEKAAAGAAAAVKMKIPEIINPVKNVAQI